MIVRSSSEIWQTMRTMYWEAVDAQKRGGSFETAVSEGLMNRFEALAWVLGMITPEAIRKIQEEGR